MEDTIRVLVALGLSLLLILLRLDADRFGAAEYDEADDFGDRPPVLRRLGWYLAGIALLVAVYLVFPDPVGVLRLGVGDRQVAIVTGLGYACIGVAQAVAVAMLRRRGLRLPPARAYPGAVLDAIGTAVVDEAVFRGIVLGLLTAIGIPPLAAIVLQAIAYTLATRVGRTGGDPYLVVLTLGIGLLGGWLTILTGGIAAAIIGHAGTRLATFVATGYPGWEDLPEDDEIADGTGMAAEWVPPDEADPYTVPATGQGDGDADGTADAGEGADPSSAAWSPSDDRGSGVVGA
jgi:membrane protease YdiL (CAAX protease family)